MGKRKGGKNQMGQNIPSHKLLNLKLLKDQHMCVLRVFLPKEESYSFNIKAQKHSPDLFTWATKRRKTGNSEQEWTTCY